jgi:hypothetical protein
MTSVGSNNVPIGVHDNHAKGEAHPMAKLTEADVQQFGTRERAAAPWLNDFRTCYSTVWLIRAGRNWRHLDQ